MNVFIPAHGFSRRVARKHTRPFAGKSLVQWSVIQCMASKHVDHCFVSTDDNEVFDQVTACGGEIIWRDYEQHPDDSGGVPTYHALKKYPEYFKPAFINMFVTSPLREPDLIDRVVEAWEAAGQPDALQAIGKQEETMVLMLTAAGYVMTSISKRGPWATLAQTTMVSKYDYMVAGCESAIRCNAMSDTAANSRGYSEMSASEVVPRPYIEVPWWMCAEPDTPDDFAVCEVLMEHLILKGRGTAVYDEYKAGWK